MDRATYLLRVNQAPLQEALPGEDLWCGGVRAWTLELGPQEPLAVWLSGGKPPVFCFNTLICRGVVELDSSWRPFHAMVMRLKEPVKLGCWLFSL